MQEIFDNCTFYNLSQFSRCKEESLQQSKGKSVKLMGKYSVCIAQLIYIFILIFKDNYWKDFFFLHLFLRV